MEGGSAYRAVQAVSPGRLELTEKTSRTPGPGKVRLRVEACGVCHSDAGTVEGQFPVDWPRGRDRCVCPAPSQCLSLL
jgi:alcohol dehydrogenase, propanol-preferring